jgi:tetratricopeptide (TPR) repeat protein
MVDTNPNPESQESAEHLLECGWKAREVNQPERAHYFFVNSLNMAQDQKDRRIEAKALLALADNALHYCPEDDPNAWDCRDWYSRRSLEIFREIGDRVGIADSLAMLACQVEYQESIRLLEESIAISREIDYAKGMVVGLVRLGCQISLNGNTEQGCQFIREALKISRHKEVNKLIAYALRSLAMITSNITEKIESFEEAIAIYRHLGLKYQLAETLLFAGSRLSMEENFKNEEPLLENALIIYRELGDVHGESLCLKQLASIARKHGDDARALALEAQCRDNTEPTLPSADEQEKFLNVDYDGKMNYAKRWFG